MATARDRALEIVANGQTVRSAGLANARLDVLKAARVLDDATLADVFGLQLELRLHQQQQLPRWFQIATQGRQHQRQ